MGQTVRVKVTATNPDGQTPAASAPTATVAQPPKSTGPPTAPTGTLLDTYTLTADSGTWDTPGATFAYTWLRCPAGASSVTGACTQVGSGPTYKLVGDDVTHPMAVTVAASSAGGTSAPAPSALTAPVAGRPLQNVNPPVIGGDPQVPATLSANPGDWSVPLTAVSYVWQRCDTDGSHCVQAATGTSYKLSGADRDHTIVLVANATSPGRSATAPSAPLPIQDQPLPQPTQLPSVSGTAVRTATLSATPGTWTNTPTSITYQWQRCQADGTGCQPIAGATDTKYVLAAADVGHALSVKVRARNTSGAGTASAKPTAAVALSRAGHRPAAGEHRHRPTGRNAHARKNSSVWQATPDTTYTTAWKRCDTGGKNCQTIAGAGAEQYTATNGDVAHRLIITITATNPDGSVTANSQPTQIVLPAVPRWKTLPGISTDPGHVSDTLSFTPGSWSGPHVDTDTTQMMRCTNACYIVSWRERVQLHDHGRRPRRDPPRPRNRDQRRRLHRHLVRAVRRAGVERHGRIRRRVRRRQRALRNSQGAALASASLQTNVTTNLASARPESRPSGTLVVRRGRKVTGALKAWACPVANQATGAPAKCTPIVRMRSRASLTVPASMNGRLRVVVRRVR